MQQYSDPRIETERESPLLEECVTFQVALIGKDGLVIGSDRMMLHSSEVFGDNPAFQRYEGRKFHQSDDGSIVCFYSGQTTAATVARKIVTECKGTPVQSDIEWENSLYDVARSVATPLSSPSDQIFVIRKDVFNAVWVIFRSPASVSSPRKITDRFCIGDNSPARFLPSHLWKLSSSLFELKKLAALTLAYAAEENPTGVGKQFDLLTLDRAQNLTWSREDADQGYIRNFDLKFKNLLSDQE